MWQAIQRCWLSRDYEDVRNGVPARCTEDGDGWEGSGRLPSLIYIAALLMTYQARRFITFIDACYESKAGFLFFYDNLITQPFGLAVDKTFCNIWSAYLSGLLRWQQRWSAANIRPHAKRHGWFSMYWNYFNIGGPFKDLHAGSIQWYCGQQFDLHWRGRSVCFRQGLFKACTDGL